MPLDFDNSYARLPERFFARQPPTPVAAPALLAWNAPLAEELGLDSLPEADRAAVFSGNRMPEGADPLAQAYAGHQFGGWVPQLGDGRALLLGEVIDAHGRRRDIQLKGSGPTPYSRRGDGRAWLGPVLREYVVSEAMHGLGIPTTRALAATATGETVLRERPLPGAVLTRVASSHIRVGTFQFFAARGDTEALQTLTDHAIARHYPQADGAPGLLDAVVQAQARLIARWMSVGFIHGVMNTDNCAISGETIDYGPCAFMDAYHPARVYSSIDHGGRYAYGNQPGIAAWNLAQFATALLPLMPDRDAAIEDFTARVNRFADHYQAAWLSRFAAKLGITSPREDDIGLITALLSMMAEIQADFTNTFRALPQGRPSIAHDGLADWMSAWETRVSEERDPEAAMATANPVVIPRNHRIEEMIAGAVAGDMTKFRSLGEALATPFEVPKLAALTEPPTADEEVQATFCGT